MKKLLLILGLLLALAPAAVLGAARPMRRAPQLGASECRGAAGRPGGLREQRRARQRPTPTLRFQGRRARPRPQRLDDDLLGAGAVHDPARPGAVLRRPGAAQERAVRAGPMPGHRRPGDDPVVGVRLQPGLLQRRHHPFWGSLDWAFLNGVDSTPNTDYAAWVSHNVFSMYQLMFAIITPALIIGAIAERMKFSAILLFVDALDVRGLFPAGAHGLGHRRLDERRLECRTRRSRPSTSPAAPWCTCPRAGRR